MQLKNINIHNLLIWITIIILLTYLHSQKGVLSNNNVVAALIPSKGYTTNSSTDFYKAKDGHFYVTAYVNNRPIQMLLDTGASDIALSKIDAQNAGIDINKLHYSKIYHTANGIIKSAPILIKQVQIGNFILTDVLASVSNSNMSVSLLGMSAIERLDFKFSGNKVTLTTSNDFAY